MNFLVRPLRSDEAGLYRDIRLEALRLHPEAFGASYENELAQPLAFFAGRLSGNVIFGGFRDQTLLGTAGFMIQAGAKRAHKGLLWGMYVNRAARGTGLARQLVEAVLDHAREHVELIQLSVVADNMGARRLYSGMGFEPFGIEARSLKVDGCYFDEVLMVKLLGEQDS
jgi:RimJ/RimL family protein N-acetyltransferase